MKRTNWLGLALVAAGFALAAAMYGRLPDPVPSHWGLNGEVNGWMPKPWGVYFAPLLMLGLWGVFGLVPRISPKGFAVEAWGGAYAILVNAVLGFVLLVEGVTLAAGAGLPVPMGRAVPAGVGLLFVVMGNYLGKVTRNFFVGIRTPWTLASEEVWLRTHRFGGKVFVGGGLALVAVSLAGAGPVAMVAVIVPVALAPIVYSYVVYRRLETP